MAPGAHGTAMHELTCSYIASIYNKLGVATRLAAARFALDHHLA